LTLFFDLPILRRTGLGQGVLKQMQLERKRHGRQN
jgi:hypothetical protein